MQSAEEVLVFTADGSSAPLRAALRQAWRSGGLVPQPGEGRTGSCRVADYAEISSGSEVQVMVTLAPVG